MCLAEALLRIPDADTADRFIAEKIAGGQWERHRGHSDSTLVNASTWGADAHRAYRQAARKRAAPIRGKR